MAMVGDRRRPRMVLPSSGPVLGWFGGFDRVVLLVTGRGLLLDEERCRPLGVCQSDTAGLLAWRWRSFLGHRSASPPLQSLAELTDKWDDRTGPRTVG